MGAMFDCDAADAGLRSLADSARGPLCVLRGGGDLATGVAWRLTRAGWAVIVLELPEPLTVRRSVALSTAVTDGEVSVQQMRGVLASTPAKAVELARELRGPSGGAGAAVLVAPDLAALRTALDGAGAVSPSSPEGASARLDVVVDARLAKRNIDTSMDDADLVVGLGPGFTAGVDCHAVVETMRGHSLGRVIWSGSAQANTATPAMIAGRAVERVLRAPGDGVVNWDVEIGDSVSAGQRLGTVAGAAVRAGFDGVIRGAIRAGMVVSAGVKIGDLDPRCDRSACWEISDKSLAVAGGVLEAVLAHRSGVAHRVGPG